MGSPFGDAWQNTLGEHRHYEKTAIESWGTRAAGAGSVGDALANDIMAGLDAIGGDDKASLGQYKQFRHWVYVAVNAIATKLAGQPIMAGELMNAPENPERGMPRMGSKLAQIETFRKKQRAIGQLGLKGYNQDLKMLPAHPVLDCIAQPNPVQQQSEFLWLSAVNLLITGVSYWVGGVNTKRPSGVEMWAVPTHWITPQHKGGLFTGYLMKPPGNQKAIPLDPANVARTYFPDPTDLKRAMSPLMAMTEAVQIDQHIQASQKNAFERGINPNIIITMAKSRGPDGSVADRRPTLRRSARRAITMAVRELWNDSVGSGDPAIIDGLIESVHKLQNTPQEMDWMQSGRSVKDRVMQAYHVNPIVTGETQAGNRAQAVEAEKNFCSMAVNPIAAKFSQAATAFLGPMYETPKRLLVWIEEANPVDTVERDRMWLSAAKDNLVTRDEVRAEVFGLPPDDRRERPPLMNLVGGVTAATQLLAQVGAGAVTPEQASQLLQAFYEMDVEIADALAGTDYETEEIDQESDNANDDQEEAGDEIVDEEQDGDGGIQDGGGTGEASTRTRRRSRAGARGSKSRPRALTRTDMKEVARRQNDRVVKEVEASLATFFGSRLQQLRTALKACPHSPEDHQRKQHDAQCS